MSKRLEVKFIFLVLIFTAQLFAQGDPFNAAVVLDTSQTESQGVAFADYNNDGWVDVYITKGNSTDGSHYLNLLFKNDGTDSLKKQNIEGVTDVDSTSGCATWGDYNNDGYIDLYVANAQDGPSPPFGDHTPKKNSLFRNGPTGLVNETEAGDIVDVVEDSRHLSWGDYDNDGYLDVFVDNGKVGGFGPMKAQNSFFENNGDGTFTEKTDAEIGDIIKDDTENSYSTFGSGFGWCDYNNDGYYDIFNGNGFGNRNRLWQNDGSGFTEVLTDTFQSADNITSTMGVSWGDYDNDGDMDLFLANIIDGNTTGWNYLYENESTTSTTHFFRVKGNDDLDTSFQYSKGSVWGDFDNDGDLDLFVANDGADANNISRLYMNSGDSLYNLTPITSFVENLDPGYGSGRGNGRGAAAADINNDGSLDLIVARNGKPLLYMNKGSDSSFAVISVKGNGNTNKSGIGAKVRVVADIGGSAGVTKQMREISGQTGAAGQNSLRAHFGLGFATIIDSIYIEWPGSGTVDIYTNLPVNQFFEYVEKFTSGIKDDVTKIPEQFKVFQNYPNPFNPVTKISYGLPNASNVSIEIYNAVGQKVETLYKGHKKAGYHEIDFNAANLSSGIYFYRVQAGKFNCVKKMMLIK